MFIRVSEQTIVNTDNIVEVKVYPTTEAGYDEDEREHYPARSTRVYIYTTATIGSPGGYEDQYHTQHPYTIDLAGDEAELFLEALPTYTPVKED